MLAPQISFSLVNGQEFTLCIAGAMSEFKMQFNLPGTAIWMDYPGVAGTGDAAGMSNPANVYTTSFYAYTVRHRIVFATPPTENYWYSIAPVTMPEY